MFHLGSFNLPNQLLKRIIQPTFLLHDQRAIYFLFSKHYGSSANTFTVFHHGKLKRSVKGYFLNNNKRNDCVIGRQKMEAGSICIMSQKKMLYPVANQVDL